VLVPLFSVCTFVFCLYLCFLFVLLFIVCTFVYRWYLCLLLVPLFIVGIFVYWCKQTILVGDSGVGKTSLLVQFDQGKFQTGSFTATVGIGFTVWHSPKLAGDWRYLSHAGYYITRLPIYVFNIILTNYVNNHHKLSICKGINIIVEYLL